MTVASNMTRVEGALDATCPTPRPRALVCRRIVETDIDAVIDLLSEGFPERDRAYWSLGFERLRQRAVPNEYPRYGYVLVAGVKLVGTVLVIFSESDAGDVRGNVSSWYVEPYYRGYSHLLLAAPLKLRNATLINISPAPTTLELISAQGFSQYVGGTIFSLTAFAPLVSGVVVRRVALNATSFALVRDHVACGCLAFEVQHAGETHPFVFAASRFLGGTVPCAQLLYCRSIEDFRRFAGPLGRRLLRHGLGVVLVDANGPLQGVPGFYRPGRRRKFSRGAVKPRLGDLSYTELAIFGS